ncbi:MAG: glycosyltransferase family 4 protein [Clostridia bacterium]|nr:glycosyltransferase family 4 protein [Clostridia bacterium]
MKNKLSVAYLTLDFDMGRSFSINYYIGVLLKYIEEHFDVEKVDIYSHRESESQTYSLYETMSDFNINSYCQKAKVFSVDCFDFEDRIKELASYDIIVSTIYMWGDIAEKLKKEYNSNAKIIYWLPSILLHEYIIDKQNKWYKFDLITHLQKKMVQYSDYIIFNSETDGSYAYKYYGNLIKKSCAIYPVSIVTDEDKNYIKPKSEDGKIRFAFAGRWDFRKGINLLVESFFRYFTKHGDAELCVLSDLFKNNIDIDWVFDDIVKREFHYMFEYGAIKALDWKRARVEYLEVLKSCDVLIAPSLYDPFNIVAYDALSLGVPIIVSRFCGVEELIKEENDFVKKINPLDIDELYGAMCEVAKNVRKLPEGEAPAKVELGFNSKEMAEKTFNVYSELMGWA